MSKRAASSSNSPAAKKAKTESKSGKESWQQTHDRFQAGEYIGAYGGSNATFHGLAALRAKVDLTEFHKKRSPDEFYMPKLEQLVADPRIRKSWGGITTMDPLGLYSQPPTISATKACMEIPEIKAELKVDGKIVNADLSININKCAVDYVWDLPRLSTRLGLDEKEMREHLAKYTCNPAVLDTSKRVYLPPSGGATVYLIGDYEKLADPKTEVAVRVHDSCCGSDVFGTDICTCRPYLVFSVQAAVECAQRGGVGVIIYYQKEGRSLGEVTKFRVYNARKAQEGGDVPEKYFYQTESIAGIRDARFQEMMPDMLLWLGIKRIDWLLSMSNEKFDAITSAGIKVMQRVALPDMFVPKGATVELNAKIASGYHADSIDSADLIGGLRRLETVRSRCQQVFNLVKAGKGQHFSLDLTKMGTVVDSVIDITKAAYPDLKVPFHSRWRHLDEKTMTDMQSNWHCDPNEIARRKIDLATVSVLLDAGAGHSWKFVTQEGVATSRSEGLANASLAMFQDGLFSSDIAIPHRVNSAGLATLSEKVLAKGFQVTKVNTMVGLAGRAKLLVRLGKALDLMPEFFGHECPRPGNIVDYVLKHTKDNTVSVNVLWRAIIEGLESIWPEALCGVRRGDCWVYTQMLQIGQPGSDLVPFHKLSQWLCYSLLEPLMELGIKFTDMHLLTGLAEYRNGGLFVDHGIVNPIEEGILGHSFSVGSEVIVEWRALTLILLDQLAVEVRKKLGKTEEEYPLPCILEGGSWQAGRAIAKAKRPDTMEPPLNVRLDGTVF